MNLQKGNRVTKQKLRKFFCTFIQKIESRFRSNFYSNVCFWFLSGLKMFGDSIFLISFEFFGKNFFFFDSLSLLLICSTIPLWYFNFKKNKKIFLGDAGSLMLGTVVSIYTISILKSHYIIKDDYDIHKILFVISILLYPIIDIIRIFFLRVINGQSPFVADKRHIHHLLLNVFKSHFTVTLIISLFTLFFIVLVQTIL